MKKLIALLMVCGFALTFVACGGGSTQSEAESQETPTVEEPAAPAEEAPAAVDSVEADTTGQQ